MIHLRDIRYAREGWYRSIIPDGARLRFPLESDLQVVVLGDRVQEHLSQVVRFCLCNVIDVLDMESDTINGIATGHGIGANDRMDRMKFLPKLASHKDKRLPFQN